MSARFKPPRPGVCRVCGCTDDHACDGGCAWVDRERTLCSACAGQPADLAYSLRWIAHILKRPGMVGGRRLARAIALATMRREAARTELSR